jgi:pimeloyl-ACP methyl ester carboxylesterase/DNA-binding CsgD family transcriptional regulator
MDAPPVQYVTTSDGCSIAYGVSGEGDPLLFLPISYSHLQLNWQHALFVPSRRPILEALACRFRVIQFDSRGQGMSSRNVRDDFVFADYIADMEAVIERLALDRFVIFAASGTGYWAIRYAIKYSQRVRALILMSTPMSMTQQSASFVRDLAEENWEFFLRNTLAPGLSPEEARRGVELLKQTTNQKDYTMMARVWAKEGIGDLPAQLLTPALVLHARDFLLLPVEEATKLAALIPGARFVLVEGNSIYGDAPSTMKAIEDFLASLPQDEETLGRTAAAAPDGLSSREVEVLRLVAGGRSNQQIADALVISLNTVRRHVSNIFDKTGVANRAEATSYAHLHALV